MDCERIQEAVSRLLDGELDDKQEADVRAHLESCAECRRRYEALRDFSAALRREQCDAPETLRENVMAALRREAVRRRNLRRRRALLSAAAVLALTLGLRAGLPLLGAEKTLSAAVRPAETALEEVAEAEEAAALPEPAAAPEANAVYRTMEANAAGKDAHRPELAALLAYLDGAAQPEDAQARADEAAPLATLQLADGTLALFERDGALCYRDPDSGELLRTARSLGEIEAFLGCAIPSRTGNS